MCEKIRIILMSFYFCVHLPCFTKLAFVIFKIINFLAILGMHVCPVAGYRCLVLNAPFHLNFINSFIK
jgi:hypothetical protein